MISRFSRAALIVVAMLASVVPGQEVQPVSSDRLREIVNRVDERYNQLSTLRADFDESYQSAGLERNETGTLELKRPGKMRWNYLTPQHKLFVSDGKYAFFYVEGDSQAQKGEISKLEDLRSPLRYLLGKTKLEKEFHNLGIVSGPQDSTGDVVLRGQPKIQAGRIAEVELEVTPANEIVRILITEQDGSETGFRFRNLQMNTSLPDSLFHFIPPPGVQVVDSAEVTP